MNPTRRKLLSIFPFSLFAGKAVAEPATPKPYQEGMVEQCFGPPVWFPPKPLTLPSGAVEKAREMMGEARAFQAAESRKIAVDDIAAIAAANPESGLLMPLAKMIEEAVRAALGRSDISINWMNIASEEWNPNREYGHFRVVAGTPPPGIGWHVIPKTICLWDGDSPRGRAELVASNAACAKWLEKNTSGTPL